MFDSIWQFYFSNNSGIINFLIIILLALFLLLFVVIFISKRKEGTNNLQDKDELEDTLRRVLASADLKTSPMPSSSGESIDTAETVSEEVAILKQELDKKAKEIDVLKKDISEKSKDGGADSDEVNNLKHKLQDLEAKLSEYEIIEDDIANLSIYKQENKKLKKELESLKSGQLPKDDEEPAKEVRANEEAEAATKKELSPVEDSKEDVLVNDAKEEEASGDDIMAEFVAAVSDEKIDEKIDEKKSSEAVKEQKEKPKQEEAKPKTEPKKDNLAKQEEKEDNDIMAEFSAAADAVEKKSKNAAENILNKETDTDKILNELDDLSNVKEEKEAKGDDLDPSKKLIDEFETLAKD